MICLLIDDVEDDRKIFQAALNNVDSSIKLVTSNNGVQALEMFDSDNSFSPDFIFLDMNMPYMSGKECLIKLRGIERLRDVPVLLYSSVSYFDELAGCGASGFITKQNSVADLAKKLSEAIKSK